VLPPAGLTWREYVERWVDDRGGWLPLADQLIHRAQGAVDIALDPQTVERGLRRLARREHQEGGQYGRWMLRFFGFTSSTERLVRWLGTGHSRFADLPCGLRLEHLALWNRPPIAESPLACWVLVGIAAAHQGRLDRVACAHWLQRAEHYLPQAGIAAVLEVGLLRAVLEAKSGDHAGATARLHRLRELVPSGELSPSDRRADRECFLARIQHLRAEMLTRPPPGVEPDLEHARTLYQEIPDSTIPFVSFRRSVGLAYCAWKLGQIAEAVQLAHRAVDDAGDAGLIGMRVTALNMLGRVVDPASAAAINERAQRMAARLGDEELMQRVAHAKPVVAP
jgi:hypothetical protein